MHEFGRRMTLTSLAVAGAMFAQTLPVFAGGDGCNTVERVQDESAFLLRACPGSNSVMVESETKLFGLDFLGFLGTTDEGRDLGLSKVLQRCADPGSRVVIYSDSLAQVMFNRANPSCAFRPNRTYV